MEAEASWLSCGLPTCCPSSTAPNSTSLPSVFKIILSPHSPVSALLFLLFPKGTVLLENIFHCFSLILPPYHSPFEEHNVTTGLHLYWVRSQHPSPLLNSSSIPPRFQRPLPSLPQLCRLCATIPRHPWGFSAAPAEGPTSTFILSFVSPRPRTHSLELSYQEPLHFGAGGDLDNHSYVHIFFFLSLGNLRPTER